MIKIYFKLIIFLLLSIVSPILSNAEIKGYDENYQIKSSDTIDIKKALFSNNKNSFDKFGDNIYLNRNKFNEMRRIIANNDIILVNSNKNNFNPPSFLIPQNETLRYNGKSKPGHWISYSAIGAGLVASIVGYSFQNKANGYYQDYSNSKIPTDANRFWKKTNDYDKLSNVSFGIGGGLIVFGIVYHYLIYDKNR